MVSSFRVRKVYLTLGMFIWKFLLMFAVVARNSTLHVSSAKLCSLILTSHAPSFVSNFLQKVKLVTACYISRKLLHSNY